MCTVSGAACRFKCVPYAHIQLYKSYMDELLTVPHTEDDNKV